MNRFVNARLLPSGKRLSVDPTSPLARGLVAAWPLNTFAAYTVAGDQGKFVAYDAKTGDLSAFIATAGVTPGIARGPYQQGADLVSTARLRVANSAKLQITGDMTIAAWLKPIDAATRVYIEKGNDPATNVTYGMGHEVAAGWEWVHQSVFVAASNILAVPGKWVHIVMVRTVGNTTITYYVDGRRAAAASYGATGPTDNTQELGIGGRGNNTGGFESGSAWGETIIWNRALTAGEVQQVFMGGHLYLLDDGFFSAGFATGGGGGGIPSSSPRGHRHIGLDIRIGV